MIHAQGADEYWLVDLGSANGTYRNGRRVTQPCQLKDNDQIEIGSSRMVFSQPAKLLIPEGDSTDTERTIQDVRASECWLLVADMVGSTEFIKKSLPREAAMVTGTWLGTCRKLIERNNGSINKYLGDGFLAYWLGGDSHAPQVTKALAALHPVQLRNLPQFRMVLHFGKVFVGGVSMGEESLAGPEVNFAFRMEKVAAMLGAPCLLSETARSSILPYLKCVEIAFCSVPSFDGQFRFYGPAY